MTKKDVTVGQLFDLCNRKHPNKAWSETIGACSAQAWIQAFNIMPEDCRAAYDALPEGE